MAWFVYILFCDNKTYYVGLTSNIKKRFEEHVCGLSPFTKRFSQFELVYSEQQSNRFLAEKREQQIKKWSVAKKKALSIGNKELLVKLSKSHGSVELVCEK